MCTKRCRDHALVEFSILKLMRPPTHMSFDFINSFIPRCVVDTFLTTEATHTDFLAGAGFARALAGLLAAREQSFGTLPRSSIQIRSGKHYPHERIESGSNETDEREAPCVFCVSFLMK